MLTFNDAVPLDGAPPLPQLVEHPLEGRIQVARSDHTHAAGGMGGSGAPSRGRAGERVRLHYEGAFSAAGQERYNPLDEARAAR